MGGCTADTGCRPRDDSDARSRLEGRQNGDLWIDIYPCIYVLEGIVTLDVWDEILTASGCIGSCGTRRCKG